MGTLLAGHSPERDGLVVHAEGVSPSPSEEAPATLLDDHAPIANVYNVHPGSFERNSLVARTTKIAEALTAMGPQRRCDLVVMPVQPGQAVENASQGGPGIGHDGDPSYTLTARHDAGVLVAPIQDAINVSKAQHGSGIGEDEDASYTLTARQRAGVAITEPLSFDPAQVTHPENRSRCDPGQAAPTLAETGRPHVAYESVIRRLTPREYERLQGFPTDFTKIPFQGKPASDSRRYKAVGNSMAVPVMEWLGTRILLVESILEGLGR